MRRPLATTRTSTSSRKRGGLRRSATRRTSRWATGPVWASLDDLARWDAGWRQGKILKPATEKLALVPSKSGNGQTTDYAFGWGVRVDKDKLVRMSHNGAWGGFLTYVDRDVAEDRTLILLSNVDSLNVDAIVRVYRAMPPKAGE